MARLCGVDPGVTIVPFRGEYYELVPERQSLVRNLIYPVPDPRFPFLGVHFTRMIGGGVEAGPNAVLAFRREGYTRTSFSLRDSADDVRLPRLLADGGEVLADGARRVAPSFSKRAFVKALQRAGPGACGPRTCAAGGAGVRAQALDRRGPARSTTSASSRPSGWSTC